MARRRKKKRKSSLPRVRNPFWRLRRVLGEKRTKSRKAYDRARTRRAEREATSDD